MPKESYNQQVNNILGTLTTVAGLGLMEELVRGTNTNGDTTDDTTPYARGLAITAIAFAGIKLLNELRVLFTNIYEDYHQDPAQAPVVDVQQQDPLALLLTGMDNLSNSLQTAKGRIAQLQSEKDKLEKEKEQLQKDIGNLKDAAILAPASNAGLTINNDLAGGVGFRDSDSSASSSSNPLLKKQ